MKIDELNKGLIEVGFKIDDNDYVLDKVTYQTMIVNGQQYKQPEHHILKMRYIGEGCELDDSDEEITDSEFHEFDVLDGDDVITTICIHDIDDLKEFIDV